MSAFDIFYLGLVLAAFAAFAITLAYFSQSDRQSSRGSAEKSSKQPAAQPIHRAERVLERV